MRLLKVLSYFLLSALFYILFVGRAEAVPVCPVCLAAVGVGVGVSRWLYIDSFIIGIWIGGLMVSMISWFLVRLDRKKMFSPLRRATIVLIFYLIVLSPFYLADLFDRPIIAGFYDINRLFFGALSGSAVFATGIWLNQFLKKKNNERSFFPFQKVVLPVGSLLIFSLIFYFFIR